MDLIQPLAARNNKRCLLYVLFVIEREADVLVGRANVVYIWCMWAAFWRLSDDLAKLHPSDCRLSNHTHTHGAGPTHGSLTHSLSLIYSVVQRDRGASQTIITGRSHIRCALLRCASTHTRSVSPARHSRGVVGRGRGGGRCPPTFLTGRRVPHSPTFLDWNSCKN